MHTLLVTDKRGLLGEKFSTRVTNVGGRLCFFQRFTMGVSHMVVITPHLYKFFIANFAVNLDRFVSVLLLALTLLVPYSLPLKEVDFLRLAKFTKLKK